MPLPSMRAPVIALLSGLAAAAAVLALQGGGEPHETQPVPVAPTPTSTAEAKSWFATMPKTMPMIFVGGQRLAASTITRSGWAATALASIALLALAWWWQT